MIKRLKELEIIFIIYDLIYIECKGYFIMVILRIYVIFGLSFKKENLSVVFWIVFFLK